MVSANRRALELAKGFDTIINVGFSSGIDESEIDHDQSLEEAKTFF